MLTTIRLACRAALIPCALIAHLGCDSRSQPKSLGISMECNLSPEENPKRALRMRNVAMDDIRGITLIDTSSYSESLTKEKLKRLAREMPAGKPTLMRVCPAGENWVFYVVLNFARPRVSLEFTGVSEIYINARRHQGPLTLNPGAHGFAVTANGSQIEHSFRSIEAN